MKIEFNKYRDLEHGVSKELYDMVLDRDGECCRECGSFNNLQEHHILNKGAGGRSDICNLVLLCDKCHDRAGRGRGKWSKNSYDELEHLEPVKAFIHSYDFGKIRCRIHNKKISK